MYYISISFKSGCRFQAADYQHVGHFNLAYLACKEKPRDENIYWSAFNTVSLILILNGERNIVLLVCTFSV